MVIVLKNNILGIYIGFDSVIKRIEVDFVLNYWFFLFVQRLL